MLKWIIIFFLLNTGHLFAQDNLLVNFNGWQVDNYIHLTFTVHGGVTCLGTAVQRSTDTIHFETIGTIPGVCGSSNTDENYMFDDTFPEKNQFNYYRINFGQLGNSLAIKLKYVNYGNEFEVISYPSGEAMVFFSNASHENLTFSLFNLQGQELQHVETNGEAIYLSRTVLPSRIYFYQVRNAETILFKGKIFLQ